jgi:hypothetical protein
MRQNRSISATCARLEERSTERSKQALRQVQISLEYRATPFGWKLMKLAQLLELGKVMKFCKFNCNRTVLLIRITPGNRI